MVLVQERALRILTVIPARGGSKGLPGKNTRPLAGIPLLGHSIRCARAAGLVDVIVSTDSLEISEVAKAQGGEVPFIRPTELATDAAAMMPVMAHAVTTMEAAGRRHDAVLLLDPTSPGRLPEDIVAAQALLASDPDAMGVVAVSRPHFNPYWVGVTAPGGALQPAFPGLAKAARRQDLPPFLRINGALYLWRREFVLAGVHWSAVRMLPLEIPESRAFSIDTLEEFEMAEWLIVSGRIALPWAWT
jgi:N-acylneuraminate cytidylyltransferase